MNGCLKSLKELEALCEKLRTEGKRIVTTNGTFDILHPGHVVTLQQAKKFGDVLIVAINNDDSVRKLKGPNRPIFDETERAAMLCALWSVDYVTIFSEETPLHVIRTLKPDFHIKGGTFIQERLEEEKKIAERYGGQLVTLDMMGDYSTTKIIEACRKVVT